MAGAPTSEERAAVDRLLGPPESGWEGGDRLHLDGHVAFGGYHASRRRRHMLLPALQAVQGAVGWISEGAMNYLCERLVVPPADAYGVASFYALLTTRKRPERVAHVCDDIACRSRGGNDILAALAGRDDVAASPCLGQCDMAPAAFVQRADEADVVAVSADAAAVAGLLDGAPATLTRPTTRSLGAPRLLRRVGVVDPGDLTAYRQSGGYRALRKAIELGSEGVLQEIEASNLRGRGGAAFPMSVKWEAVAGAAEPIRYLICNADESEPGTFKDRVLMEGDPFALVEAMTVAGVTIGAAKAYLYIRAEYPRARQRLQSAIDVAREAGLLGGDIAASGLILDIEIRSGAGAYICGEETALMNSIEGRRGEPRNKPPFPTEVGLFGKPTVINNVETLVNVLDIVLDGGAAFAAVGTQQSAGPKLFCLSGDVGVPGTYEVPFGTTLGELVELAGGVAGNGELRAILLGGAAGTFIGPDMMDLPLTFEGARDAGVSLGSGVVMLFDTATDFADIVRRIAAFFRDESCGQCVPCRVGTVRQEELLARHQAGHGLDKELLGEVAQVMVDASICGLGHTAASAIRSAEYLGLV
ncbi:MAG: NAD(P)H-dependent oxidoreductase subunit E [Acidimicrobiia bacterium]|nr:NAD(P)H-dependent oxidoreductase subunit E [Acidimicrobiia bacterium]